MSSFVWLRRGDSLPAVAVAQLLLKRTGHSLAIDGIFGSGTQGAVRQFQAARTGLADDGVIGRQTWPRLRSREALPVVDCIDVFDPDLYTSERRFLTASGSNPITIGGMCNGIEQAVTDILRQASNLFLLRFHGHGAPGVAGASDGHGELGNERSSFQDDPETLAAMRRLRKAFGPYGCIQFMHCDTGSGPSGAQFLRKIADATGVPATGAHHTQYASTLRETVRYEGPARTVCPGGKSLGAWARSLPNFTGMSVQ